MHVTKIITCKILPADVPISPTTTFSTVTVVIAVNCLDGFLYSIFPLVDHVAYK